MTNEELASTRSAEEKHREALWLRMRKGIVFELTREDGRTEDDIFCGRGGRLALLGAIADLTKLLLVDTANACGDCKWREMVSEVHREMLKWVEELECC